MEAGLVPTNDEVAQSEVSTQVLNSKIPFVCSGVNEESTDDGSTR